MPLELSIAVALVLVVAAWSAGRYLILRRRLQAYSRALRHDTPKNGVVVGGEIEDLSSAVNALAEGLRLQISDIGTERDRLAAVLAQMTDGVLIADAAGQVQFANPAACRLFDSPDALGHSLTEVLRNHQLVEAWRRCRSTNELQSESVEIPMGHRYLRLIVMPDKHAGGSLLLVQDLTRLRQLETVRRDFISNLSHELRTPLASLKALTETLQGGALSDAEAGPRFLDRMDAEVDALTQMTQELLDLSRIESGQTALELSDFAPAKLVHAAAERMRLQIERARLRLRIECPDDLPGLRADRVRLEQILVNLIHNAVKFNSPGGEVVLSAEMSGVPSLPTDAGARETAIRFAVKDTGIGIPADDVPRIFERFYQVDKARSGRGAGLGLSIAKHIVETHGGRIWVESVEGQGSTFVFTIPRSR